MSNEEPLAFAMDRGAIWKSGLSLLRESGLEYSPADITELAEFLAGDNIPYPMQELNSSGDDDEQQVDSSAEGTE